MMMRPFLQCGVTAALDGCVAGPAAEWQHFALAVAPMPETCAALPSVHTAMPTRALWSVVLMFEHCSRAEAVSLSQSTRALDA